MNLLRAAVRPLLAVAVLAAPCAAARAEDAATAFQFPAELAGFSRGEVVDFEAQRPGLGFGVPYSAPGVKATVYVYGLQIADLPEGIASSAFLKHARQTEREIVSAWADVQVLSAQGRGDGHCGDFMRTRFSLADPRDASGDRFISHLYLGSRKGNFIKIRVTYAIDGGVPVKEATQERFTQAVCKLVGD